MRHSLIIYDLKLSDLYHLRSMLMMMMMCIDYASLTGDSLQSGTPQCLQCLSLIDNRSLDAHDPCVIIPREMWFQFVTQTSHRGKAESRDKISLLPS